MDTINKYDNRAKKRAAKETGYTVQAQSLFTQAVSADENIRTEVHVAAPDYTRSKTEAGAAPIADEANPNTTPPPASEIWDLKGYMGGHGYMVITGGGTVDVQMWVLDPANNQWFLVTTQASVATLTEFRFANQIRGRSVWLRLINFGGAVTSAVVRFSPE